MRITHRMNKFILVLCLSFLGLAATVRAADKPAAPYPLTTCVVSGEALNDMGKPVSYTHKEEGKPDRLVMFCCKSCIGKFKKDPVKYLAKLAAAEAAAKAARK